MIKIEINGQEISAEAGSMIIQVADKCEIPIPRFCYHPKLSIAANCRMCLVQVEKSPKPLPACATPIVEGMKIWTASKPAIEAQQSVMEFLLINHPLDCPICDQGGECELQDISMQYGTDRSRYDESKRVVADHDLGSLIATDLTRCIQCTRCVRFGEEIAGQRELGATGRNDQLKIETFMAEHVNSEVSGNVIDLCPVGALTSKPFRFQARAWELEEHPGVSAHDCIGSNLSIHTRRNQVMRVVPREAEDLNEIWLADRDRFSYTALAHSERLHRPMLHKPDRWAMVSWLEALKYAMAGLQLAIENYGSNQLGVLISPNATLEEQYLLQNLARGLGSNNIDHRLRELDFSDQQFAALYPNLGVNFKDIEQQDVILVIGSNVAKELPVLALKLRKAAIKQAKVCAVNPMAFEFNFKLHAQAVREGSDLLSSLAAIAKVLLELSGKTEFDNYKNIFVSLSPTPEEYNTAQALYSGQKKLIVLGQLALMHPKASEIRAIAKLISDLCNAKFATLSAGANSAGAWLTGCVPHRACGGTELKSIGKNALEMLSTPLKAYILFAIEPDFDSVLGEQAMTTLKQADFVVAFSAFESDSLLAVADVILPIALLAENSGTMLNIEGRWQTTNAVVKPLGESKPAWKILRVLGHLAGLKTFEFDTLDQVYNRIKAEVPQLSNFPTNNYQLPDNFTISPVEGLTRVAPISLYAIDYVVRRSLALQATRDAITEPKVELSTETANKLDLKDGETVYVKSSSEAQKIRLKVAINETVPALSICIYQANTVTNKLGLPYAQIEVTKC